jgi:hypothetical protein
LTLYNFNLVHKLVIAGLGTVTLTTLAVGVTINFLGFPGLSAAGIVSALATIGSILGLGMFAGVVTINACGVIVGSVVGGVFVSKFCL